MIALVIRAAVIYLAYLAIKRIWKSFKMIQDLDRANGQHKTGPSSNEDIVEADYTVIDEEKIGD